MLLVTDSICGSFDWKRISAGFCIVYLYLYRRGRQHIDIAQHIMFFWGLYVPNVSNLI